MEDFVVDLDAARAIRREANKQPPKVVLGGQTFLLPIELPLEASLLLADMSEADEGQAAKAIMSMVEILLGDQAEAFLANKLSGDDLKAFLYGVLPAYGFGAAGDLGESQASESSSPSTSRPSKPTSNGSIDSTSELASTAPKP